MLAACLNLLARCSEGVPSRDSSSSTGHERLEGRSPYDSRMAINVCQPLVRDNSIASA